MQNSLFPQRELDVNMLTDQQNHWLGLPVHTYSGDFNTIQKIIPSFERRPLITPSTAKHGMGINSYKDLIVRMPTDRDSNEVPVGMVSKSYRLIQHSGIFNSVRNALSSIKVRIKEVRCELSLTEYGERMNLSIHLPPKYNFNPGDGEQMGLRLECLNSVEGSTRFQAFLGWFRFVCSNGMIVGITSSGIRRLHNKNLDPRELDLLLTEGIPIAELERDQYKRWVKKQVTTDEFVEWVDTKLKDAWGVKAALRTCYITLRGKDVKMANPFEKCLPSQKSVRDIKRVPGSIPSQNGSTNVFAISQALSWLAKERREIPGQIKWKREIPHLLDPLIN